MVRALKRYRTQSLDYFSSRIKIPKIDYDAWIYALRAACAGCLALYISFSLNLDGSHWALTTCYIVGGQRQTGSILAKSAARIVGTLVGVVASFTLVNAFAQERVLFICCFAAWLSICAYFSHYQRGALGLCLGSVWIPHRHRRGSCGIGAEPSLQCNYE